MPLRQQANHQLGGGAHQGAGAEVAADHGAPAVGHSNVQMGAIGRKGAGQAEYLQLTVDGRVLSSPRKAQLSDREAAHGANHAARLLLLLAHPGFQRLPEVVSRRKPQRHHLHGVGPSTSPWNITKAST